MFRRSSNIRDSSLYVLPLRRNSRIRSRCGSSFERGGLFGRLSISERRRFDSPGVDGMLNSLAGETDELASLLAVIDR